MVMVLNIFYPTVALPSDPFNNSGVPFSLEVIMRCYILVRSIVSYSLQPGVIARDPQLKII